MSFRKLDEKVLVAGQIAPAHVSEAARMGVTLIVNNRPDGEEAGQPDGASLAEAAAEAGLDYRHIPVAGGFAAPEIDAMAQAIDSTKGKMLAFCRSGTRSTYLWALARSVQGIAAEDLARQARAAGHDLSPILPHLRG